MDPRAMMPLGVALRSFLDGDNDAVLTIRRDDGVESAVPVSFFFREGEASVVDQTALAQARGFVLDIGAGSGLHSLVLQKRGLSVTAIDVDALAVEVMRERGVADARQADVFSFEGGPFDTLLMMGHGIGVVETVAGLDGFLSRARRLIADGGQILLDSLEVHASKDAGTLAYHEANRQAGRYIGEVRVQLEFQQHRGEWCGWLHVDSETLAERANALGWQAEVLARNEPEYLARLSV